METMIISSGALGFSAKTHIGYARLSDRRMQFRLAPRFGALQRTIAVHRGIPQIAFHRPPGGGLIALRERSLADAATASDPTFKNLVA
jgi:hypothetical protein